MPALTIDNQTTVTNTPSSDLTISAVIQPQINVITVTGPAGAQGPAGPAGTGDAGAAGVSSLNGLTGALTLVARNGALSPSGSTLYVSGYVPISTQINGFALTGDIVVRSSDIPVNFLPGATYSNLQQFINTMNSPGLIQGAFISDGGGGVANISVGTGMLRIADDNISSLSFVNIPATGLSVPADVIQRYVGFVYNNGSPKFELRMFNDWDNDTEIALGTVVNYFGQLVITNNPFLVGDPITNIIQRFDAMAPVTRDAAVGGLILGEMGTRNITLSAGKLWTRLNDYDIIARNTAASDTMYGASFNGVFWDYQTPLTQWPNTQYNDPAIGLVDMSDTYYANLWFYCGVENGALGFIYGQNQWGTYSEAAAEQAPSLLPDNFTTTNVLAARLTFQKSAGTSALISSAFTNTFTTAPVSVHNTLGGLQGGATAEFFHLSASDYGHLTGIAGRLTVPSYLTLSSSISGSQLDIGGGGTLGASAFTGVSGVNGLTGGLYIGGIHGPSVSQSGQTLFISGQDWATSGNLTSSGAALYTQINSLSGFTIGVSGALQAQIVDGAGTQVKISGSATLAVASFTGIGGTVLWSSGSIVYVSGEVSQTKIDALSGYSNTTFATKTTTDLISGNLTQTGVQLALRDAALSGAFDTKITQTGVALYALASGVSGNLGLTGQALFSRDTAISGAIDTKIANTGQGAYTLVTGMSGQAATDYATKTSLASTGQQAWSVADSNGRNISGNLTLTGAALVSQISSLSGFTISASGALQAQIAGANGTQVHISGSNTLTNADFTGIGSVLIYLSGSKVYVSGAALAAGGVTQSQLDSLSGYSDATFATKTSLGLVSGNLTQTGVQLINRGDAISGGLEVRITATGLSAVSQANSVGQTVSGNLTSTGVQIQSLLTSSGAALYGMITGSSGLANGASVAISGALTQSGVQLQSVITNTGLAIGLLSGALATKLSDTGAALITRDALISGGLEVRITTTGGAAVAQANSVGQTISGNLTATGVQIGLVSGALSQRLTDTGSALFARDLAISGALQAMIAGGGSVVKITGSALLATADFTGIGGLSIFSSGGQVFISGAAPGAGGGVSSINATTGAITINASGGFEVSTVGSTITISGLPFAGEGQILFDNKDTISGDSGLTWNPVSDVLTIGTVAQSMAITSAFISGNSGQLSFSGIANNPIAGMFTSGYGNTLYGPAWYDRRVKCIVPNITTSQTLVGGDSAANVGTLSTVAGETLGEYTLYTPTAGQSAGASFTTATAFRGTGPGVGNGFFFVSNFVLNSNWGSGLNVGTYGAPSGCRIFVGMTDQAVATQTQLNDPIGSFIGLQYLWASGGAVGTGQYMQNWAITSRNNVNTSTGNMSMVFQTGLYRFSLYCPPHPANNIIYYQMDDILRGSGVKGQITSNLPLGSAALRPLASIGFVSGIKAIGTKVLYVETRGGAV